MAEETSVNNEMEIKELNTDKESKITADETTPETEQIREKIEETRQGMSETIDAIQEKLSLANISEQVTEQVSEQISNVYESAKETVYQATLGKVGTIMNNVNQELQKSNLLNKAVENPFPLFLMALGAGLILFRKSKNTNHKYRKQQRHLANGKNKSEAKSGFGETVSSAYQSVTDTADSALSGVSDVAGKTYNKIGDLGTSAQEKYNYYLDESPLAVGAVALAVGATVGMMLPTTQYEENLIGETSRNLLNMAQTKTQETVDSIKSVAGQAVETVKEEVNNYQQKS